MFFRDMKDVLKYSAVDCHYGLRSIKNFRRNPKYLFLNSIPKSGTHMINGLVEGLLGSDISLNEMSDLTLSGMFNTKNINNRKIRSYTNGSAILCHLLPTDGNMALVKHYQTGHIFLFRDPRAVAVSYANWVLRTPRSYLFRSMSFFDSFEIQVEKLLLGFLPNEVGHHFAGFPGIKRLFEEYSLWLDSSDILFLKFEDLVGKRGGGCEDTRIQKILALAQYLGTDTSRSEVETKFHSERFSVDLKKAHTFHSGMGGRIDGWKQYFNTNLNDKFLSHGGDRILKVFDYDR